MYTITIDNPVSAIIPTSLAALVAPCVSYDAVFWKQGFVKKERKTYSKSMITKGSKGVSYVWSGLVPTIVAYCKEQGIIVEVVDVSQEEMEVYEPCLPGITFRPDQLRSINAFLDNPRGIISSFTGSGKTVIAFGILSAYPKARTLWMCHKKDLAYQARDEAIKFGFKDVGIVGDGLFEIDHQIVIATRQSFNKVAEDYGHLFDIVVVDEGHHIGGSGSDSEYAHLLARVPAPVRLSLTATQPRTGESYLTAVGLIGPIIAELTTHEGADLNILAVPTIRFIRLPESYELSQIRNYQDAYQAAIVNREIRNKKIAEVATKHANKGESVLILINHLQQGENIMQQLALLGAKAHFVQGSTPMEVRMETKQKMKDKDVCIVVASLIWLEGLDVPNLDVVILAQGGKAEIGVLQAIGRGLRKTKNKSELYYYDILDLDQKYLIAHLGQRLGIYSDNNWL